MIHKIDQIFIPKNFLIIGDIMLDIFEYGKVEKISSEAP
ncbi:MAG TPA: D-glycero-beta-D-manno-heptose-7-phosphate kinase, partial [Spirochaetia bacterium]|nr:D-glycero-beta-D-manno-heptose-7-phosphate kinase [Spirochaetia bacterium]